MSTPRSEAAYRMIQNNLDPNGNIKKVKLTIPSVYLGSRFITCIISGILLDNSSNSKVA
jgi:hypothetical protein